jgi:hypothetical protein
MKRNNSPRPPKKQAPSLGVPNSPIIIAEFTIISIFANSPLLEAPFVLKQKTPLPIRTM